MRVLLSLALIFVTNRIIAHGAQSASWSVIDPESYPYVANVVAYDPVKGWIAAVFQQCTGILISRSVVLTSGHCLKKFSHTVEFSKLSLRGRRTVVDQTITVNDQVYHRESDLDLVRNSSSESDETAYVDVGLMVLEQPLPICENKEGRRVYTIGDLPIVDKHAKVWEPRVSKLHDCSVVGFGRYDQGQDRGQLRRLKDLRIDDNGNALFSSLDVNPPICGGDAGAPLICASEDNKYNVLGMASFSKGERIQLQVEGEPQCFANPANYEMDVFGDLRKALSVIREGLAELGKLDEFIQDNEKCFEIQLTH